MNDHLKTENLQANATCPSTATDMDRAARSLGLRPVRAFVPDDRPIQPGSPSAKRTKRSREKSEAEGLKQLSATLPSDLHPLIKTLAARTRAGESAASVLVELMPELQQPSDTGLTTMRSSLSVLPAWRRWLVLSLLPIEFRRALRQLPRNN